MDENISHFTKKHLKTLGFDVKDIYDYDLGGSEDEEIVRKAIEEGRVIITLDTDFSNIYYFSEEREFGVIVVKVHPPTVENVNNAIANFLKSKKVKEADIQKSLIILGRKIRIRGK
ncbi:MAG: DUF5615 family PIN-like protein [Candidatus Hydrothermarchaeota archaeon]|nr:DUF5615 family PIN-like protein [Candidatus Hydrothermarchaeota archaeon]